MVNFYTFMAHWGGIESNNPFFLINTRDLRNVRPEQK